MKKKEKKKGFILKNIFHKESEEVKKLKELKKKIRKIKTIEDLDALEDELVAIGVVNKDELEKMKKRKNKKKRKLEKELFEERIRCNLEIINRTIAVGKNFKSMEKQRKDEERIQNKEERMPTGNARNRDRDERLR